MNYDENLRENDQNISEINENEDNQNYVGEEGEGDENFLNYEDDQSYEGDQSMSIISEDNFKDILEELEPDVKADYPNEAYADLMTLVTKRNLSNATGNAIIKFFNKHANLNTTPLPKSIEEGRKYMDNINMPNFTFDKTHIITYNNTEYYLYHRSLVNCIKNILSISDISQNFALTFKKLKVGNNYNYNKFILFHILILVYILL